MILILLLDTSPKTFEAKNGLAFDVILDHPKAGTPQRLTPQKTTVRNFTNDDIRFKLQKAEERRHVSILVLEFLSNVFKITFVTKSLEKMKLASINEKNQKIEEAAKFRVEIEHNFSKETEKKLIFKMETNKENRAALLSSLMDRLKKTVN